MSVDSPDTQRVDWANVTPGQTAKLRTLILKALAECGTSTAGRIAESAGLETTVVRESLEALVASERVVANYRGGDRAYRINVDPRPLASLPLLKVDALVSRDDDDERVWLLVRKAAGTAHAGKYVLPGGGVEDTDRTITEALVREVSEETGIRVAVGQVIGAYDLHRTNTRCVVIVFEASTTFSYLARPRPDGTALAEVESADWYTRRQIADLFWDGALTRIAAAVLAGAGVIEIPGSGYALIEE